MLIVHRTLNNLEVSVHPSEWTVSLTKLYQNPNGNFGRFWKTSFKIYGEDIIAYPTQEILTTNKGRWNIKEISDFCIKWQWSKCNTIDSNTSITKLFKNLILKLNLTWSFTYQDIQLIVMESIFSEIFGNFISTWKYKLQSTYIHCIQN